jgi:hypothetical protein
MICILRDDVVDLQSPHIDSWRLLRIIRRSLLTAYSAWLAWLLGDEVLSICCTALKVWVAMQGSRSGRRCRARALVVLATLVAGARAQHPWLDVPDLSPEERAEALMRAMTTEEKLAMVHGATNGGWGDAGYVGEAAGVPRLGVPGQ